MLPYISHAAHETSRFLNLQCRGYSFSLLEDLQTLPPRKGRHKTGFGSCARQPVPCCGCSGSLREQRAPAVLRWDRARRGRSGQPRWKEDRLWGIYTAWGLVLVTAGTQEGKCSGAWPAEKSLQKEILPWLKGGKAEPCIKVTSRGLRRSLGRPGQGTECSSVCPAQKCLL